MLKFPAATQGKQPAPVPAPVSAVVHNGFDGPVEESSARQEAGSPGERAAVSRELPVLQLLCDSINRFACTGHAARLDKLGGPKLVL